MIRVTKEFHFEMAHALWNYDGDCKNIHGHSYRLFVTVTGNPITELKNPKLGMVIDFGDLKKIVNSAIIKRFDHALALYSQSLDYDLTPLNQMFDKLEILDYQPTCENLVTDFAAGIIRLLPANVKLFSLRLQETDSSYSEWYASDN